MPFCFWEKSGGEVRSGGRSSRIEGTRRWGAWGLSFVGANGKIGQTSKGLEARASKCTSAPDEATAGSDRVEESKCTTGDGKVTAG